MEPLALALFLVALGTTITSVVLWRANRALSAKLVNLKSSLDRTSKILIEKNLELSDQNLEQQKELQSKDDFVSIVSHQLRTPITEMKWNIQSILLEKDWQLNDKQHERIETLYESVDRMVWLINDILNMVSVDQNAERATVMPYAPDSMLKEVAGTLSRDFRNSGVTLSLDLSFGGTIASLNKESFVMATSNLIENAFHYTLKGGSISVSSRQGPAGECVIEVRDNGIGISPEQQKRLYEKFKRGEEATKINPHGSGLGLYIVKKILSKGGGEIAIQSTPGAGTTCTLTITP